MNLETITNLNQTIAVISDEEPILTNVQSALDLIMAARYTAGSQLLAIDKRAVTEKFFILSNGLAGEILQKFINYRTKLAIYGDFSHNTSRPLQEFMWESNNGNDIFFTPTKDEAIRRLTHG